MPRSSIVGTGWQSAWGTAGTQSMMPALFIEGLGSWAGKMDDRMCFLAYQQTDVVFSEDMNTQYGIGHNYLAKMAQYHVYYNGHHPQMLFGFNIYRGGLPLGVAATLSVKLGDVDFGTAMVVVAVATAVEWYADIPESFAAGEYKFKFYGGSGDDDYFQIDVAGPHLTFLPTRL